MQNYILSDMHSRNDKKTICFLVQFTQPGFPQKIHNVDITMCGSDISVCHAQDVCNNSNARVPDKPRAHFNNDLSILIQIRWKICFAYSIVYFSIATKYCIWHDSCPVVPYAKFHSDHICIIWMSTKRSFRRIWITVENHSWNWLLIHQWIHILPILVTVVLNSYGIV